jgi:hypothetical protein
MSLMSATQHLSMSGGAIFSSVVLSTGERDTLIGIPRLGTLAMAISALVPLFFWLVERRVVHAAATAVPAAADA